jgi:ABC-type antimicrobial peptide transport system permease subunit
MVFKNLWRRKTRTLLTTLGIAVGVAAVVALSAFGEGIAGGFEKMFSTTSADLTVGQKDAVMLMLSAVDTSVGDEIAAMPGVEQVAGTVVGVVQMPESPYFIVMGEDPRGFRMEHYRIIAGGPLTGRKQILLGKITAENFDKQVGQTFRLNGLPYRVAGIYETGVSLEDGGAVMRLDDAQRAFDKREQVSYYGIKVKDAREIPDLKETIESTWPELAATRSGEATQQTEAFDLYRSFGLFLGIFAVLVGGLGMMNTMLMSVLERTREIGVLRAVGWRRWRVLRLILGEAFVLSAIGGLLGIGLGIGLTELTQLSPSVKSLLQGVFTPAIFVQAAAIAILLGMVGGFYPAWRASRLAPIEAMRYDSGSGGELGGLARRLARVLPAGNGALRNLWRRPARTLFTLAGIGIGVGFIVALIAMTEGFITTFTQLAGAGQMDLVAEESNTSDMSLSEIDDRLAARIETHPDIQSVSKIIVGVSTAPGLPYFMVFGLDPHEDYIQHYRVREGRIIQRPREIVIGRFAANSLKKQVGDKLRLAGQSYEVVGIYENGQAYEDAGGLLSLSDAQSLFNRPGKSTLLGIKLAQPENSEQVAQFLEAQFPQIIVSRTDTFAERLQDFKTTYAMLNALIILTVVVGGIVMMNAMLMSVFERTQEIGVLRALGWKGRRVIGMVLTESLALSLLSAVLGIGFGIGLNQLLLLEPTMGYLFGPTYSWQMFVQVTILALGLGAAGGVYPAWRAAGLRPIEALRYE